MSQRLEVPPFEFGRDEVPEFPRDLNPVWLRCKEELNYQGIYIIVKDILNWDDRKEVGRPLLGLEGDGG